MRRSPSPSRNPCRRRRSPSPPPPPRRSLAPLLHDFFPFPFLSSPSSSDSHSAASPSRRRKLKLLLDLSHPHLRRAPSLSASDSSEGEHNQVKPPNKRPIERSRHRETCRGNTSSTRSKRLAATAMARRTPLPDLEALEMILGKLQKKDTYGVFAEPVDPEELPDYFDVIDHPMDFSTVRRKLARNAYHSFEHFEDDVFLICSNAMQYNAPDTIYFRQAHSIQELARKKFHELRDDGISTENEMKYEQKFRPNSCRREPVKMSALRNSEDYLGFSHNNQVKKSISRNSEDDLNSFHKEQVNQPIWRSSEVRSSSFQKGQVKKSISRNSEDDLSYSFHKKKIKKSISRNSEDDLSSSFHNKQLKKPISRNSKNDSGFSSQKRHVGKPMCRYEDLVFSSHKETVKKPACRNGKEDQGLSSHKEPVEEHICSNKEDKLGYNQRELVKKPVCRDGQDDPGYYCNKVIVKKPVHVNGQDAPSSDVSDVSAATVASAGDSSNGLSMSQANAVEPQVCTVVNVLPDKDNSSSLDEIKSEKADELSARVYPAKTSYKPIVVDETRRTTYSLSEEQPSLECDSILDVFAVEPNQLISIGVDAEYSYARSLSCFAASLGSRGWKIASECMKHALPAEVKFGRGWIGECEPLSPPILVVDNQSKSQHCSEANSQSNVSPAIPRDAERPRTAENGNPPSDMCTSLLSRITTGNAIGVAGPLESPEFKPRLFSVTAESQQKKSGSRALQEIQKVTGSAVKTKEMANEQMKKSSSSFTSTRPLEMAQQRPECSRGASSGTLDVVSSNKMNGQPKNLFRSPEAVALQLKNEATWVYHGRPGDGNFGTPDKSRPISSNGFITKNQPAKDTNFVMNVNGQMNINDHGKLVGSSGAIAGDPDKQNKGLDAPRNLLSAFPDPVREQRCIPASPAAKSLISFGASAESKPAVVSPSFLNSNFGWRPPFANAQPCDDLKARAVPQFFREPVQVVSRESPVQNKGLVIFPQLVPTDFLRLQGQPQWQDLVLHVQQKPSKDTLRPDLNMNFPSPGSPPARQSSSINLEAQQPDLALQL